SMPVVSLIQNALLAAGEMANNYESSQHLAETLDFYRGLLPNAGFFVDRALKELPLLRTDAETHDLTQRTFDDILQDICFEPPSPA
ncbi:hypothetical protein, partial [Acinetobacter baumannii]|uniref:hypothetical protein n=1 Tax=Acinetobacter baumannii TaxID=470 RepID=UPI0013D23DEB